MYFLLCTLYFCLLLPCFKELGTFYQRFTYCFVFLFFAKTKTFYSFFLRFFTFSLSHVFDKISTCFSQYSFSVHSIQSCDSSFRAHSGVVKIPHLPTSVVLHDDKQNGYEFKCHKIHHGSGALWFVNQGLLVELGLAVGVSNTCIGP